MEQNFYAFSAAKYGCERWQPETVLRSPGIVALNFIIRVLSREHGRFSRIGGRSALLNSYLLHLLDAVMVVPRYDRYLVPGR
jgi:hypothetical protein